MGKKRNIVMDQNQEEELQQRASNENKYASQSSSSAYDLPDEFAELEALRKREEQAKKDREGNGAQKTSDTGQDQPKKAAKAKSKKVRSKRFKSLKKQTNPNNKYSLEEAVQKVLDLSSEKFDTSIELNLQTKKENISGTLELPHGTGKTKKVVIFDDQVLAQIEAKKADFDVLIAKPEDMAKLAKHAKFLGPKGLMPNPKNGTITRDPEKAAKDLGGNKIAYKTEKKAPLIHLLVGKKNFGAKKLQENISAAITTINPRQIKSAAISSTMGPGLKLDLDSLS
ncbi:hypothetical protein GYA49_03070 [Candidatus Beckwithbacteria bacterium]|nr:hypothetical protein [Candidatus Beckwithbacteria bacterium]